MTDSHFTLIDNLNKINNVFEAQIDKYDNFKHRNLCSFLNREKINLIKYLLQKNNIEIIYGQSKNISNCYNSRFICVKSKYELSKDLIKALRESCVLGSGQEFHLIKAVNKNNLFETVFIDKTDSSG